MTGTAGHSGGTRQGAGRPPQSVRLRQGQKVLVHEQYNGDPVLIAGKPSAMGKIEIIGRGHWRLTLPDGTVYSFMA